jgi:hypothetical protein
LGNGAFGDYEVTINVETKNDSIYLVATLKDEQNKFADTPRMLIKLSNDSTIELQGINMSSTVKNDGGIVISGIVYSSVYNVDNIKFPISKDQIIELGKGIKKIRFNTTPKFREKGWGTDKIGKKLYEDYKKSSGNSFNDNF